jgi:hypothetical protein
MDIIGSTFDVLASQERAQLEAYVETYRIAIADSLDGLSEAEVRERLVPSKTTLLGLVKHTAYCERVWSLEAAAGRPRAGLGLPATVDESFDLTPADTIASVLADHDRACTTARGVYAGLDLDDVVTGHRAGPMTVRWIHLHLVRELAQHVGHAEILRELLLARRP